MYTSSYYAMKYSLLKTCLKRLVGSFVYFQALPLNIVGVDGSPVRAIAMMSEKEIREEIMAF
ncbi:hypothetical protein D1868_06710 [Stygiolobus azoricus]|uniref:Uncharacterized protein n=2 Tax=Stygiolobus azoricus TaxID=41675 RepID=A0A650CPS6_9CREN|nr:hypothetical protein D1868_06710 [Stygiolobus azoricus]